MQKQKNLSGGHCNILDIDDGGVDQSGGSESDEEQLNPGQILLACVQSVERKRGIRDDSEVSGLNNRVDVRRYLIKWGSCRMS